MKVKLLLAFALVLTGCVRDGVSTTPTDNPNFLVAKLFTVDGCTMYRFYDAGDHWFMTCPNGTVINPQHHPKIHPTDEVIETVPVEAP